MIPTLSKVTAELLDANDRLRLIQQCGAGLEGLDIAGATEYSSHGIMKGVAENIRRLENGQTPLYLKNCSKNSE